MQKKKINVTNNVRSGSRVVSGVFINSAGKLKKELQIRTYWGRGNSYKKIIHFSILLITVFFVISGISTRVSEISASRVSFQGDTSVGANIDTLQQGVQVNLEAARDPVQFKTIEYTVLEGDTIESIAGKFKVSTETIQWANSSKINYFDQKVKVGDLLVIPEITGVLYAVEDGDTLDSVLAKTSGNKFEVIELNLLVAPNYALNVGSRLLIPNGKLPPPPPPAPIYQFFWPSNVGENININVNYGKLKDIAFVNPLSNPSCAGYVFNQAFWAGHDGVDLGRYAGCPIRAAAAGVVMYAGNAGYPSGYTVRIDHGNGVHTIYYHGSPVIWVRPGQEVYAGQEIMEMGATGRVFIAPGSALLHLSLRVDGVMIDPSGYIPY